ncbi:hypothetical protein [Rouxiella sp. WC2420]|uniref:Uncharacterized protein n=1 Tax=Rouxiella sp. WC2420 TaxID=3234145 RepID=A0AB39VWQ7_9GAMM
MSLPDNSGKANYENIHFDTLLEKSLDDIQRYSGNIWTDKGEHDPGVTLLQALTWSTADLAFRHTFPAKDLLQPKAQGSTIFPSNFGPRDVLTCAPITLDDYRRGILDLCNDSKNESKFYFSDVQITPVVKVAEQYQYSYDQTTGHFLFKTADDNNFHVVGDYEVNYQLNRGVDDEVAHAALVKYLAANRHLCESFREPKRLDATPQKIIISLELTDDWIDYQTTLNQVVLQVEDRVSPQTVRSNSRLNSQGINSNDLIEGPKLDYGWIEALPATREAMGNYELDISVLAKSLLQVPGVKSVQALGVDKDKNWKLTVETNHYPLAWGVDESSVQQAIKQCVTFTKKGQILPLENYVEAAAPLLFNRNKATKLPDAPIPAGKYRNPDAYYPASNFLPAAYGLKQSKLSSAAKNLALYLFPFESWNYLQQSKMMLLPEALTFERDSTTFGKTNWLTLLNFTSSIRAISFLEDKDKINIYGQSSKLFYSPESELGITSYLLNYFGNSRADRTLIKNYDSNEYRDVQYGFLRQNPEINYSRGNIDIHGISGLQRIIAARLGRGVELFAKKEGNVPSTQKMSTLPFYIVENRQLLPPMPNMLDTGAKTSLITLTEKFIDKKSGLSGLKLTVDNNTDFKVGMLADIELIPKTNGSKENKSVFYKNLLIRGIELLDSDKNSIKFYCADDPRLSENLERIIDTTLFKKKILSFASAWLQNNRTPISSESINNRTIKSVKTLPDWLQAGVTISFYQFETSTDPKNPDLRTIKPLTSTITTVDRVNNTFSFDSDVVFTEKVRYYYEIKPEKSNEPFSSTLSCIFPRSWLDTQGNDSSRLDKNNELAIWIEQVIKEEIPIHLNPQIHYLDSGQFNTFSDAYQRWQNNSFQLGGDAYAILEMLSLGQRPRDNFPGIGVMRVYDAATEKSSVDTAKNLATEAEKAYALQDTDIFFVAPVTSV